MTNPSGGFRRRSSYIAQERAANPISIVVDSGDALTGKARPGIETKGRIVVQGMNLMGYDAMALGPLDLDLGRDVLLQRMNEATFPCVSANAVDTSSGELVAKPYVVIARGETTVGILGITRPPARPLADFEVTDPLAALARYVPEVQREAKFVLVLTSLDFPTAVAMASVVPGITAMFAGLPGDYPQAVVAPNTGTIVASAEEYNKVPIYTGRRVGRLVLPLLEDGTLGSYEWESKWMAAPIPEDPSMVALLSAAGF